VAFISETAPFEVAVGNVNAVRCDDEELRLIGSSSLESCNFLVTDAELTAAYIGCAARASRQRGDAGAELR